MIKGVTEKEYKIITDILRRYPGEFYAYGSRVKGGFSPVSDLDILVKSDSYEKIIYDLKDDFDKSYIPYIVNFTDYNCIDEKFYNLIKNDLTLLYKTK